MNSLFFQHRHVQAFFVGMFVVSMLFIGSLFGAFDVFGASSVSLDDPRLNEKCQLNEMVDESGICVPKNTGLSEISVLEVLITLMRWLFIIFGSAAIIAFIISGIMYLMAAGDTGMADNARSYVVASIVGVVVALAGLIILTAVNTWLGGVETAF